MIIEENIFIFSVNNTPEEEKKHDREVIFALLAVWRVTHANNNRVSFSFLTTR
jgi:hypothetical protein